MDDEDIVSKSFLTVFFMDTNTLRDSLAGYRSIILRLKIKTSDFSNDALEKLDDAMKNAVIQWSDNVRMYVERCQIAAQSLSEAIPEIKMDNLDEPYKKIINQFTPDIEDVSKYTFEINKTFVKATIEKILNKMDSFYEQFTKK